MPERRDLGISLKQDGRCLVAGFSFTLQSASVPVLDEPTRNFSPLSCPVVRAAPGDFGGAIISVSHGRKYLQEVCDQVYRLIPSGLTPLWDLEGA